MKIQIELDATEVSEVLMSIAGNCQLHQKFVSAIMVEEGYENKSSIGPAVIPFDWMSPTHPELGTVRDNVKTGRKIQAIKIVREKTGLGVKEAKDIMDSIMGIHYFHQ